MWLEISRYIVFVASIAISFGLWDQALKIWRTKSAKDFTVTIIVALIFNEIAWVNYGLALKEWPIVIVDLLNVPAVFIAGLGFFRYRK